MSYIILCPANLYQIVVRSLLNYIQSITGLRLVLSKNYVVPALLLLCLLLKMESYSNKGTVILLHHHFGDLQHFLCQTCNLFQEKCTFYSQNLSVASLIKNVTLFRCKYVWFHILAEIGKKKLTNIWYPQITFLCPHMFFTSNISWTGRTSYQFSVCVFRHEDNNIEFFLMLPSNKIKHG